MYSPQYPTAFFTSWASSIRGSLLAWFTSSISTAPETDHIIRHSILTSRPETTASWTLITDGLRCNAGDQKDWKKLRAPSSPFNEQRKAAPISQESSRIPRGWLIRKARHWRAFSASIRDISSERWTAWLGREDSNLEMVDWNLRVTSSLQPMWVQKRTRPSGIRR